MQIVQVYVKEARQERGDRYKQKRWEGSPRGHVLLGKRQEWPRSWPSSISHEVWLDRQFCSPQKPHGFKYCFSNIIVLRRESGDFPGGPRVKTPCFHCSGHWIDRWGIKIPHALQQSQKEKKMRRGWKLEGFRFLPKEVIFPGAIKDTFYSYNNKILM